MDSLSVSNVGTPIDAKGEESPHNAGTHSGQNLTEWLAALRIGLKQQVGGWASGSRILLLKTCAVAN